VKLSTETDRSSVPDAASFVLVVIAPGVPPDEPKMWFSYVDCHYLACHWSDDTSCCRRAHDV